MRILSNTIKLSLAMACAACSSTTANEEHTKVEPANAAKPEVVKEEIVKAAPNAFDVTGLEKKTTNSGLIYYVVEEVKEGISPNPGQLVNVHYTGYLEDGTKFDSSHDRGQPLPFTLGKGQVIKGWEEGIALIKVGEKARLIIPPYLAYGERGYPNLIPANATLVFDVELVSVE